jgi:outer membrane biosynthesis protein TonB
MNLEIHYTPPNQSRQVVPVRDRLMIGSLLSNEVVIRASGVEPIHAMIEVLENGIHILTDLGSQSGVYLNGQKVDVESPLKVGDKFTVGNVQVEVMQEQAMAVPASASLAASNDGYRTQVGNTPMKKTTLQSAAPHHSDHDDDDDHDDEASDHGGRSTVLMRGRAEENAEILFSPRNAKPSTSSSTVLECVAYWDDTILDVDMFHPRIKGNEKVTIGTPSKAHFLAGGSEDLKRYKLASVSKESYAVHLRSDMTARVIKGGRVSDESGDKSLDLGKNDIVHITHGAIKYFLMFIKPPVLDLPRSSARDPFFAAIIALTAVFYVGILPLIYFSKGTHKADQEDIWSIVNTPDKKEVPKPPEKKKVEVAEVKKEPPPPVEPPKPPPKPPTPVKPEEKPKPVEKPQQTKPVEKPVEKELAKTPTPPVPTPKPPTPKPENSAKAGMAKAEKKPDMVNPGKVVANKPQGPSGGAEGGGKRNDNAGGQRKGNTASDLAGVENGKPNVASGVNLGALGVGVGKILDKNAAGAIKTDFTNSVGGVGGGSGSGPKTTGLGGPGAGKTLGVAGTGGAANNFGGFGGNGSGAGGAGGLGGAGLGSGFGKGNGKGGQGRANIEVPPGDPVVSGGLTSQEVQAVIRANLNQIRHCYEQLLQRSPNANGKIKVAFVIGPAGTVISSAINSDTVGDSAMAGCVSGKVQRWKFPQPRGGVKVDVNYPFVFNPM